MTKKNDTRDGDRFIRMRCSFMLTDPRYLMLSDSQKALYLHLQALALQDKRELLSSRHKARNIAFMTHRDHEKIQKDLNEMAESEDKLISIENNRIRVNGVREHHGDKIGWRDDYEPKDMLTRDIDHNADNIPLTTTMLGVDPDIDLDVDQEDSQVNQTKTLDVDPDPREDAQSGRIYKNAIEQPTAGFTATPDFGESAEAKILMTKALSWERAGPKQTARELIAIKAIKRIFDQEPLRVLAYAFGVDRDKSVRSGWLCLKNRLIKGTYEPADQDMQAAKDEVTLLENDALGEMSNLTQGRFNRE